MILIGNKKKNGWKFIMILKIFLNFKKKLINYIMFIVKVFIIKYLDKYFYKNCYFCICFCLIIFI